MSQPNESTKKVLTVSALLCAGCSVLVSVVAVALSERQAVNAGLDRKRNVLVAAGLVDRDDSAADVEGLFRKFQVKRVDLATGEFVAAEGSYDFQAAMKDPKQTVPIPAELDAGSIRHRPRFAEVYALMEGDRIQNLVLPIVGKGLWSTMWGFVALESDLRTVKGLVYYQHGETPGLGGEVDNPNWRAQWGGKCLFDENGTYHFTVLKGFVPPDAKAPQHQADGISGATLTCRGVNGTLQYWMGTHGYGPLLERLRKRGA